MASWRENNPKRRQIRKIGRGPVAKQIGLKKGDMVSVKPIGKPKIRLVGSGSGTKVQATRNVTVTVTRPVGRRFGKTRRGRFT